MCVCVAQRKTIRIQIKVNLRMRSFNMGVHPCCSEPLMKKMKMMMLSFQSLPLTAKT